MLEYYFDIFRPNHAQLMVELTSAKLLIFFYTQLRSKITATKETASQKLDHTFKPIYIQIIQG